MYEKPTRRIVAEFLGRANWVAGTVGDRRTAVTEIGTIKASLFDKFAVGSKVSIGFRPEWVEISTEKSSGPDRFPGTLEARTFLGDSFIGF